MKKYWIMLGLFLGSSQALAQDRFILDDPTETLAILEKLHPIVMKVNDPQKKKWTCAKINLEQHCGDGDGCTVTLNMTNRLNPRDHTLGIKEFIFMEQRSQSANKNRGLNGYTRQASGGEHHWNTGAGERHTIFAPWAWTYMLNYDHVHCHGRTGKAYADPYEFSFMVHPHVSSLIIIED